MLPSRCLAYLMVVFTSIHAVTAVTVKKGQGSTQFTQDFAQCSRTCVAKDCNTFTLRYGKYCGVGHGGCIGEEPCDDLDSCCKGHDDCVMEYGMNNVECHLDFKECMQRVAKSKKKGFSKTCPYSVVIPTMMQGMDLSIMLSQAMQ